MEKKHGAVVSEVLELFDEITSGWRPQDKAACCIDLMDAFDVLCDRLNGELPPED